MITAARPVDSSRPHYYEPSGTPVFGVANKSKPGEFRAVTIRDCRTKGLVPSPTTVCRLLHRHALVQWMCEQACLAVLTTPRKEGEALDAFVERVIQTDRVQDEERDAAAKRGKELHKAIRQGLLDGFAALHDRTAGQFTDALGAVMIALNRLGRCVATEKILVGDGYVGTTDCLLENEEDIWVIDFKTCRRIPQSPYDEQLLQVAAYCGAVGNTGSKRIRGMLFYVSTTEPGKTAMIEVDQWHKHYRRFLTLLQFWKMTNL